ncbi:preprotein translocase subunit YajC [Maritalea mediterranea]|uniref:Sec translocon accessory complex subunit YajC n=1 Tax=Maritalea mediterranea TaxID=2909667 RepID=A0ABS9E7Y1_9HYPH|nr:preprotein translocase subunit YajC [Maritalea mediterranea]MCF4098289.1 preprotein translocase subunit YajC [Maritalea mediterranea]
MLVSPAFAQAAGAPGAADYLTSLMPILLIIPIFYFLIIRPQQKRVKEQKAMLDAIRRNDVIVTNGGIIGKVTRVKDDNELEVELAENVRVKVLRSMVADVRTKAEPVNDNKK